MRKAVLTARIALVILAVMVLGLALSCGGGHRTASVLPGVSGDTHNTAGGGDRTASVPLSDIGKLDPRVQELYADPGWEGPVTPQAPVEAPPAPPELTIERILSENANVERLDRQAEPVVDSKGASYPFVPPTDPNYFPMAGEYDPVIYPGSPPLTNPPYGSDDASDGDRLEDRLQRADQFNKIARSFVRRGITVTNQFNRGFAADNSLAAIYQSFRDVNGKWGEWSYPASQTYVSVPSAAPIVSGNVFDKLQLASKVKRFSQVENFALYDILIAPMGALGSPVIAPQTPNETYASVQEFFFDTTMNIPGAEAWMVALTSSSEDKITELIGKQTTSGPVATFPVFGTIFKRWADDVYNVGVDEPYTGRLGWPLGDPFIDRSGRYLTGPNGQYLRYGQYFEKGYMWWNDYISPNTPDEVYIYMYDKDCTLITGGTYTQDPAVVKYGTGGPLGVVAFANPTVANVGDPIYFKAFPYGGPTLNANGFADDWYLWNFRDGTVSAASQQYPIHEYFTEANYTPRLMFTIDFNGDGNPDGNTNGYKVFADTPIISIGHLGAGGGGGSTANICIVDDGQTSTVTSLGATLTDLGIMYDTKTSAQVTSASVLAPYLLTIWCPTWSQYGASGAVTPTEKQILYNVCSVNNQNLLINWGSPYPYDYYDTTWGNFLGSQYYDYPSYNYGYGSGYGIVTAGFPLGSGPGGSISQVNWSINPSNGYEYTWAYLYYYYALADVTKWGHGAYEYYWSTWVRDANGAGENGKVAYFGLNWDHIASTTPAGPGKSGLMENMLNLIDPALLESGGSGGLDPIEPYDGPVDIADVFAWYYSSDGSLISGGHGDDLSHRVAISVISTPKTVNFDCLARAKSGVDLTYQWEFMPSGGYGTWTKYTSYAYTGGVDPDGSGPAATGDPFPVNCRVYNSTYGSYASAPAAERDSDSVLVQIAGALPVDIMDNGTVIASSYSKNISGNVVLDLKYKIINGAPPYDSVYVDYDYNFVSFQNRALVGTNVSDGTYTYTLTIPSPSYRNYYIAIRVNDADAPNLGDTYVWTSPVKVAAPVVIVNTNTSSNAMTALKNDLTTIGCGYNEKQAASLQQSDVNGMSLVIVHLEDHRTSYSPSSFTSAMKTIFINYWNAGGNTIVMMPCESDYYLGGSFDNNWLAPYWDMEEYNSPYAYCYGYTGYWDQFYDNCPTYNGLANGPGGTVSNVYYNKSSGNANILYLYNGYGRIPSTRLLMGNGAYTQYNYYNSWYLTTSGGGRNVIYGHGWDDTNSSSMSGTAGRSGMLRNLIEIANPSLM